MNIYHVHYCLSCRVGLVFSVPASHVVGRGFASRPGYTKDNHKNDTNCLSALHACVRVAPVLRPILRKKRENHNVITRGASVRVGV